MTETDLSRAEWHKSSFSSQSGNCVEVARNLPGLVGYATPSPQTRRSWWCHRRPGGLLSTTYAPSSPIRAGFPLTAADQAQAPPDLRAALSAITRHVDDYANRAFPARRET